jgi:hypothetical protein
MKNTKLLKALLTIVTAFVIIFLPLWVGPEIGKGTILDLIVEWFMGLIMLVAAAIVIYIIYFIITAIYDLWDDIIN